MILLHTRWVTCVAPRERRPSAAPSTLFRADLEIVLAAMRNAGRLGVQNILSNASARLQRDPDIVRVYEEAPPPSVEDNAPFFCISTPV